MTFPALKRKEILELSIFILLFGVVSVTVWNISSFTHSPFENDAVAEAHTPQVLSETDAYPESEFQEYTLIIATPSPTLTKKVQASPTATKAATFPIIVGKDQPPSTYSEMLKTLNDYRASKGKSALTIDANLQTFAQNRAEYFSARGSMDNHAQFQQLLTADGFAKMGFNSLGENSSYGAFGDARNLIESIYAGHAPHDENQLKDEWTHVGIGVSGEATDFVFGGRKR
jgi:uncharacterized protein YkwD